MPGSPPLDLPLASLLAFYAEAGADEFIEELGINRFQPKEVTGIATQNRDFSAAEAAARQSEDRSRDIVPRSPAPKGNAVVPDEGQAALARELAAKAQTLDELRSIMENFEGCNLRLTAKQLVFADGNPNAELMLVGEAPGRDEDIEGLPFVGRSGQLLDLMLAAIGRDRASVYIANVIPWRPPGNRTPTPIETEICRPFIERQIELVAPKVLMTLGSPSAKTILRTTEAITRLRGNWGAHLTRLGISIPTMPTLHPAYLLRTPAHKKFVWRDLLAVKAKLASC